MSKNDKKHPTKHAEPKSAEEGRSTETGQTAGSEAKPTEAKPKGKGLPPAKPSIYLQRADGVQFAFTRFKLPKKANVMGQILVEGIEVPYQVTNNKGFTPTDKVINYSWITLPAAFNEGPDKSVPVTGYITHDYNVSPVPNESYTVHSGKANRTNPERVPKDATVGAGRVEKFKSTMAIKKAAADAGKPAEAPQS